MGTYADLIYGSLAEIRVARSGEPIGPDDQAWVLYLLNELLNEWGADERAAFASTYTDYTLTPGLLPHTIGPTGTFTVAARPVRVTDAALNIGGSPAQFTPITIRQKSWYAKQTIPALSVAIPTDLYYSADWPNGSLYFYPVPSLAKGVRLWTWSLIGGVVPTDDFDMPQGYQAALRLTLAERAAPSFNQTPSAATMSAAARARARIFANNDPSPRLSTRDSGMPKGVHGGWYDYRTGLMR